MIIKCYNESHPYLVFFDIEFNNKDLVQFAGLLFRSIDDETYQLVRSCNQYVTTNVCYPFMEYTNITNTFLNENGIRLNDLITIINDDFLDGVNLADVEFISHGLRNDRLILQENGINFISIADGDKNVPIDGYCTFNNAKRILKRESHLTAADLAEECGYYLHHAHNAFNDVWAEVAIFTYLKKIEEQNIQESENNNNELS